MKRIVWLILIVVVATLWSTIQKTEAYAANGGAWSGLNPFNNVLKTVRPECSQNASVSPSEGDILRNGTIASIANRARAESLMGKAAPTPRDVGLDGLATSCKTADIMSRPTLSEDAVVRVDDIVYTLRKACVSLPAFKRFSTTGSGSSQSFTVTFGNSPALTTLRLLRPLYAALTTEKGTTTLFRVQVRASTILESNQSFDDSRMPSLRSEFARRDFEMSLSDPLDVNVYRDARAVAVNAALTGLSAKTNVSATLLYLDYDTRANPQPRTAFASSTSNPTTAIQLYDPASDDALRRAIERVKSSLLSSSTTPKMLPLTLNFGFRLSPSATEKASLRTQGARVFGVGANGAGNATANRSSTGASLATSWPSWSRTCSAEDSRLLIMEVRDGAPTVAKTASTHFVATFSASTADGSCGSAQRFVAIPVPYGVDAQFTVTVTPFVIVVLATWTASSGESKWSFAQSSNGASSCTSHDPFNVFLRDRRATDLVLKPYGPNGALTASNSQFAMKFMTAGFPNFARIAKKPSYVMLEA
jgi:hypothetical protein